MSRDVIVAVLLVTAMATASHGQVPQQVVHQGVIVLPGGRVPLDGSIDLSFEVFDSAIGGSSQYQSTLTGVAVEHGLYSVVLEDGAQTLSDAFGGSGPRFLEVTIVDAPLEPDLNDTKLSPRQYVAAVPYALRAGRVRKLVRDETSAVPRGAMILWSQATGCEGAPRSCPCGYDEAGEFRGRTVRGVDLQSAYSDLPDEPGVSLGEPGGSGQFGDRMSEAEAPPHLHDVPNSSNHNHDLSDTETAYFYGGGSAIEDYEYGHRHAATTNNGTTTSNGDHDHEVDVEPSAPHMHPLQTVLFCRKG